MCKIVLQSTRVGLSRTKNDALMKTSLTTRNQKEGQYNNQNHQLKMEILPKAIDLNLKYKGKNVQRSTAQSNLTAALSAINQQKTIQHLVKTSAVIAVSFSAYFHNFYLKNKCSIWRNDCVPFAVSDICWKVECSFFSFF
ncbi:MAG: Uncharacterised protein [Bacteroidota bacterium]|nr:MAG: Uncharacterised protein [Bacteroidota bacterium]